MTEQELWDGLQEIESCGPTDRARELVRGLLGRMDREELVVVARAVARTLTPKDFADMDPEDRELWRGWRISAALRDRQDATAGKAGGGRHGA